MSEAHKEQLKVLSTIRYIESDSATPYYHGSLSNYVRVQEPIQTAKVFRLNTEEDLPGNQLHPDNYLNKPTMAMVDAYVKHKLKM